jgi:hypothetical protein
VLACSTELKNRIRAQVDRETKQASMSEQELNGNLELQQTKLKLKLCSDETDTPNS